MAYHMVDGIPEELGYARATCVREVPHYNTSRGRGGCQANRGQARSHAAAAAHPRQDSAILQHLPRMIEKGTCPGMRGIRRKMQGRQREYDGM